MKSLFLQTVLLTTCLSVFLMTRAVFSQNAQFGVFEAHGDIGAVGKTGKHTGQVIVGANTQRACTKGDPVGANRACVQ